jgi:hypothetical protein
MTTSLQTIDYPSGDRSPVAESFVHLYAILTTLEVLRQFLEGQQATVLCAPKTPSEGFPSELILRIPNIFISNSRQIVLQCVRNQNCSESTELLDSLTLSTQFSSPLCQAVDTAS